MYKQIQYRETVKGKCVWFLLHIWAHVVRSIVVRRHSSKTGVKRIHAEMAVFSWVRNHSKLKTLFSELQFPKGSVVSQYSWEPSVQMPETRRDILHLNIPNILSWVSHNVCFTMHLLCFTMHLFSEITSYFRSRSYLILVCCMETGTLTTKLPFQLRNNFLQPAQHHRSQGNILVGNVEATSIKEDNVDEPTITFSHLLCHSSHL